MTSPWQPPDPLAALPPRVPSDRAQFAQDVRWALSVCRAHPFLSVFSLVVGLAPLVSGTGHRRSVHDGIVTTSAPSPGQQALSFLVVVAVVAFAGWPGTQRLWFLRAATGRTLGVRESIRVTFRYFGRFAVLGLAMAGACMPLFIALAVWYAEHIERLPNGTVRAPAPGWRLLLVVALVTVAVDIAFTFITPALVFSSHRVRDALRIGSRLLAATWPAAAPYALVPPLAAVALSLYSGLSPSESIPLVAASTLLNLIVKGATAAYYLRVIPAAGLDGALVLTPKYDPDAWRHR